MVVKCLINTSLFRAASRQVSRRCVPRPPAPPCPESQSLPASPPPVRRQRFQRPCRFGRCPRGYFPTPHTRHRRRWRNWDRSRPRCNSPRRGRHRRSGFGARTPPSQRRAAGTGSSARRSAFLYAHASIRVGSRRSMPSQTAQSAPPCGGHSKRPCPAARFIPFVPTGPDSG